MKTANKDLAPERHERLREIIRQNGVARVDLLCEQLQVSPATVRRDLEELEAQGKIRRVHGGAVYLENGKPVEPLFDDKAVLAAEQKMRIAAKAASLVESGDTIYLDGGSTILELARRLTDRSDITVVTNSLRAALELSGRGPDLVLVGGNLRRRSQTLVGSMTRHTLEHVHVDKAFMGTIGISAAEGMTTTADEEAFTKELVMRHAAKVILLADSTKAGKVSFAQAGKLSDVDLLITDEAFNPELLEKLKGAGIESVLV